MGTSLEGDCVGILDPGGEADLGSISRELETRVAADGTVEVELECCGVTLMVSDLDEQVDKLVTEHLRSEHGYQLGANVHVPRPTRTCAACYEVLRVPENQEARMAVITAHFARCPARAEDA
jgi:hypothetical protein